MLGFPDEVPLTPLDWGKSAGRPGPGELAYFVPQGFGLGSPPIITPYGGAPKEDYYGFQPEQAHPILNGPTTEPNGGTIYFGHRVTHEALLATLGLIGVQRETDYIAFGENSSDPVKERYLDQLRIVSTSAAHSLYGAFDAAKPPTQTLEVVKAIGAFVEAQKVKWLDGGAFSSRLRGLAGGDGDWAKESLAFGFHVENSYWGVYRVWSRAWLVTK